MDPRTDNTGGYALLTEQATYPVGGMVAIHRHHHFDLLRLQPAYRFRD
jgi:hypothetical protein